MNERLAKLTEQCYEYNETMQGAWFNKTKFAELIVRECIEVLETNNANLTSDFKWDAIHEIEKHFGVKK
jgi:hypothetical protein